MEKDVSYWSDRINEAITQKVELSEIDLKADISDDNSRLKEHINAMGHFSGGGALVFGITRNYEKASLEPAYEAVISKITSLARDTQEPPLTVEALFVTCIKGKVLCIHIKQPKGLPIFIKDRSPLGGHACFKRSGSQTIAMSVDEIRDLLAISQTVAIDEGDVEDSSLNHLDLKKIEAAVKGFVAADAKSSKGISALADAGILSSTSKQPHVTVAGWLMFARDPQSVRKFKNAYIEFQQFKGKTRDEVVKKTEIKGPLTEQIENAISLLMQHMWVVPNIVGVKREETPSYDKPILREIITNAVVHRDYTKMHQPVKIALFVDRLEVESPGGLMPGLTTYNLIHRRAWRNQLLAERMKIYGLGEMDGQGIDRLFAATRKIQLPAPAFTALPDSFKVTLSGPKKFEDYSPNEKRLTVLVMLILSEYIDNESIRHAFGIDLQTAGTLIKSMASDGVIETVSSSRKYARYKLTQKYQELIFS